MHNTNNLFQPLQVLTKNTFHNKINSMEIVNDKVSLSPQPSPVWLLKYNGHLKKIMNYIFSCLSGTYVGILLIYFIPQNYFNLVFAGTPYNLKSELMTIASVL